MEMKGRYLCVLLALLLFFCPGCTQETPQETEESQGIMGEALTETLGVPENVQGEFVSESGISRVIVDAEIVVPEIDHADIIEAIPRVFTEEEITSLITRHEDEIGWYDVHSVEAYKMCIRDRYGTSTRIPCWPA